MLADRGALGHRPDDGLAEVLRVRAREADPLDARHCVHGPEKLAELRLHVRHEVAAPRVDVLAEERHLAHAVGGQRVTSATMSPGLRLCSRPRTAGTMQYEQTELQPMEICTQAWNCCSRRAAGRLRTGSTREAPARDAHAAGADPVGQVRDRPGAERDVHGGIELEDPLALRLGVAPTDRDDPVGVGFLERGGLREVRREALVGLLADGARVEDDDVRLLGRERFAEAE